MFFTIHVLGRMTKVLFSLNVIELFPKGNILVEKESKTERQYTHTKKKKKKEKKEKKGKRKEKK